MSRAKHAILVRAEIQYKMQGESREAMEMLVAGMERLGEREVVMMGCLHTRPGGLARLSPAIAFFRQTGQPQIIEQERTVNRSKEKDSENIIE